MSETRDTPPLGTRALQRLAVVIGAVALTLLSFLVLPLIQAIGEKAEADTVLRTLDAAELPPPPAPPPPEPEPEKEPEPEEPPKLAEEAPPLDLAQLELALGPSSIGGWTGGDFAVKLESIAAAGADADALFSLSDLDQKPRAVYQPSPLLDAKLRQKGGGEVVVLFVVDQQGRVVDPIVQSASDPAFGRPVLAAIKQWRFEPGKRNGQPVRFRMRQPFAFPK